MVWDWRALYNCRFFVVSEIDRKPDNVCDIQNAADGILGTMIQLKLVKNFFKEYLYSPEEHDGLLHGTKVMLNILKIWVNKQWHVVSVYSYFALVQACDELKKRVLRFIGMVKTETIGFCMAKFRI